MSRHQVYVGINNEVSGGMTAIGKVIRDAKVFGLIDDDETCEGWDYGRIGSLLEQVNDEWDKYGCLVSQLPKDLFERHQEIHSKAIELARAAGWSGEFETKDES